MTKRAWIRRFSKDERGATAIEYSLLVGIMSVVVVGIMATGGALDSLYDKVCDVVSAMGGGGACE